MTKDPYAQHKAETIAARLFADPEMQLSQPVLYRGGLADVLHVVRMLQHRCGFPASGYQVKFNAEINALRLSDYHTRHVCEPGEYFWMLGDIILGGSPSDHAELSIILAFAKHGGEPPAEASMTASAYSIVRALLALRQ